MSGSHDEIRAALGKELRALSRLKQIPRNAARRAARKTRCLELLEAHEDLPGPYVPTTEAITATRDADLIAYLKPHQVHLPIGELEALSDAEFIDLVALGLRLGAMSPCQAFEQTDHLLSRYAGRPAPALRQAILDWQRPSGTITAAWWLSQTNGIDDAGARALASDLVQQNLRDLQTQPLVIVRDIFRRAAGGTTTALPLLIIGGFPVDVPILLQAPGNLPGALPKIFASWHGYIGFKSAFPSLELSLTPDGIARLRAYVSD